MQHDDRRAYPRWAIRMPVVLSWPAQGSEYPIANISAGGLFVIANQAPSPGSELTVALAIDDDIRLEARSIVVRDDTARTRPATRGFAVRFAIPERDQQALHDALVRAVGRRSASQTRCDYVSADPCDQPALTSGVPVCALHAQLLLDTPDLPNDDPLQRLQLAARRHFAPGSATDREP